MSEWKPGDVAMVPDGRGRARMRDPFKVRPLVVIDPEDAEQVQEFADTYARSAGLPSAGPNISRQIAAALREFAAPTPPRPDEPQGLGAVVEDARGRVYVRVAHPSDGWAKDLQWQRIGGDVHAIRNFAWPVIEAVRVLSEGVTP